MTITVEKYAGDYTKNTEAWNLANEWAKQTSIPPTLVDQSLTDYFTKIQNDDGKSWLGLFIGRRDGVAEGFFVMVTQDTPPSLSIGWGSLLCISFYNGKSAPDMRLALIEAIRKCCRDAGSDFFLGLKASDGSDDAWTKLFEDAGKISKLGTLFYFDVR